MNKTVLLLFPGILAAFAFLWFIPTLERLSNLRYEVAQLEQDADAARTFSMQYAAFTQALLDLQPRYAAATENLPPVFDDASALENFYRIMLPHTHDLTLSFLPPVPFAADAGTGEAALYIARARAVFRATRTGVLRILQDLYELDCENRVIEYTVALSPGSPLMNFTLQIDFPVRHGGR